MLPRRWSFRAIAVLAPLLVPPLLFAVVGLGEGMGLAAAASALVDQYSERRFNLLMAGVLGLLPVGLLGVVLWIHRKLGGAPESRSALAWGGLLPILAVLIWVNFEFWPTYLPDRTFPGFPHGLELVIGPLFFAPVAMVAGMVVAWIVSYWTGRQGTLAGE